MKTRATAFAPASVANVAVGFDVLGFSVEGAGDEVTVTKTEKPGSVQIEAIEGIETQLPLDPNTNTATVGLKKMLEELKLDFGFSVKIRKGIAMGSGMGGSSASAVGAVVAANELLPKPLSKEALFPYALAGEEAASGSIHGDNVGPCLFGGLCLVIPGSGPGNGHQLQVTKIPVPKEIFCVLVHPELKVETRQARSILKPQISLPQHIEQSAHLGGFLAGCFKGDLALIQSSLKDVVIEHQRKHLITGFDELKSVALANGALGFSISGSGPSVFAWAKGKASAEKIESALKAVFEKHRLECQSWISPVEAEGARVIA